MPEDAENVFLDLYGLHVGGGSKSAPQRVLSPSYSSLPHPTIDVPGLATVYGRFVSSRAKALDGAIFSGPDRDPAREDGPGFA